MDTDTETAEARAGSRAAGCSAIDMPGAAFDVETEIRILEEAMRIIKARELPKHEWTTWDSFAGRQVENSESDENWMRRVIRKAVATILPNRPSSAMTDAPPTTPDCKTGVTGAAGIRCSAWLGRIVCGDNVEVLSQTPDAWVDLVVTSPPYDDLRTYGGHSWNFETLAAQLVRVLKPGGVIVWVVNDATVDGSETLSSAGQAAHFKTLGMLLWDTMIFLKKNPGVPTEGRYYNAWEYMFVLSKGKPKTTNWLMKKNKCAGMSDRKQVAVGHDNPGRNGEKWTYAEEGRRTNVWEYSVGGGERLHPAPFPEKLAQEHVLSWSNPGDVVLDPFAGSGTTLLAAKELNREWCGIEINPAYCRVCENRLSQDVLQLETCAMRPNK